MNIAKSFYCFKVATNKQLQLLLFKLLGRDVVLEEGTALGIPSPKFYSPATVKKYARVGAGFVSKGTGRLVVGQYCAFGEGIKVITSNHELGHVILQGALSSRLSVRNISSGGKEGVNIGPGCWLGDNCIILPGVTIGEGSVVGAGTVVTKDVPPYSIVVGNPGSVKKKRFPDKVIEQLLMLKWYEWDEGRIGENKELLASDISQKNDEQIASLCRKAKNENAKGGS